MCIRLNRQWLTLIDDICCVALLLELLVRENEVLKELTSLATHVVDEILRHEAQILLDLLDKSVAIFEI